LPKKIGHVAFQVGEIIHFQTIDINFQGHPSLCPTKSSLVRSWHSYSFSLATRAVKVRCEMLVADRLDAVVKKRVWQPTKVKKKKLQVVWKCFF